jgi:hypothetical protein
LDTPFDSRLPSGRGALAAVVEAGNFVRAAGVLGLTQSGVSRAVARLEQRVGVRLRGASAIGSGRFTQREARGYRREQPARS